MSVPNLAGIAGFTNDGYDLTAQFTPGLVIIGNGTDYIYTLAAAAQAAAATFALTGAYGATTTTTGTAYTHDVTGTGVPINTYFWAKKVASPF